jgi:hypothetical protein
MSTCYLPHTGNFPHFVLRRVAVFVSGLHRFGVVALCGGADIA